MMAAMAAKVTDLASKGGGDASTGASQGVGTHLDGMECVSRCQARVASRTGTVLHAAAVSAPIRRDLSAESATYTTRWALGATALPRHTPQPSKDRPMSQGLSVLPAGHGTRRGGSRLRPPDVVPPGRRGAAEGFSPQPRPSGGRSYAGQRTPGSAPPLPHFRPARHIRLGIQNRKTLDGPQGLSILRQRGTDQIERLVGVPGESPQRRRNGFGPSAMD